MPAGRSVCVSTMNAVHDFDGKRPAEVLADLVARHGGRPVLLALVGLLLRPRPKDIKPLPDNLSDHLLRDVGLPPEPQARKYWEIR